MKKVVIGALCLLATLFTFVQPASACTIFSASERDTVLFGNNEDWLEKDTFIWFVPQSGEEYGRVCVGFENAHPQGGMNDQGLAIDWVVFKDALPENLAPDMPGKETAPRDINDMILASCATVDDVVAFYQRYNDPNLGYAMLLVADREGESMTVTWDRVAGSIALSRGTGGMQCIGYGQKAVEGRYSTDATVSAEAFRALLEAAEQPDMTLYSNIFDLQTGDIRLYHAGNYDEAAELNLMEELDKGTHMLYLPSLFSAGAQAGCDAISAQTLLPLYLRIVIWTLCGLGLLYIAFAALSLKRCKDPTALKISLRWAGIASAAAMIALLVMCYFRWYFIVNYGFAILGWFAAALSWVFMALAAIHTGLCVAVLIQRRMAKGAVAVHIIASVLLLLLAVEFVISGFMGI